MSAVPHWLEVMLQRFGEGLGLQDLAFQGTGVVSLRFETGVRLRFEYAFESLAVMMTVPTRGEPEALKRLLDYAHPARQRGLTLRTGYLAEKGEALMMMRLPAAEVTLPALNGVFQELWRLAEDFRNREL